MIMAHKNVEQLKRLIKNLECEDFYFFIHLDKEWKLSGEEIEGIRLTTSNVYVIKKRIHGELDKFSLVQIALNLSDAALEVEKEQNIKFSYFLLLSGQDYPIKNTKYILEFLKQQYPKPLIDIDTYKQGNWLAKKFELVKWVNKMDRVLLQEKPSLKRKIKLFYYILANKLESISKGSPYERLQKHNVQLGGGSAWWILPHGVIENIYHQRISNKKLIKDLKSVWTPEENFFQIMTLMCDEANLMVENDEIYDENSQQCMTFANFITPTKPFRGHPHTILLEDFDRITSKKALFARKFDVTIDKEILDKIDKEKLNG